MLTRCPRPPGLRHCPLRGLCRRYKGAASLPAQAHCAVGGPAKGCWRGVDGGVRVQAGLPASQNYSVSPQVMEARQAPGGPRARLLLMFLLLAPWGARTASGVALPPAGVFRYAPLPGLPGRVGIRRDPKREEGEQRLRKEDRD